MFLMINMINQQNSIFQIHEVFLFGFLLTKGASLIHYIELKYIIQKKGLTERINFPPSQFI